LPLAVTKTSLQFLIHTICRRASATEAFSETSPRPGFCGRPSPCRLWEDRGDVFRRINTDFDPRTKAAVANGAVAACC
jgi:hypothetical protein